MTSLSLYKENYQLLVKIAEEKAITVTLSLRKDILSLSELNENLLALFESFRTTIPKSETERLTYHNDLVKIEDRASIIEKSPLVATAENCFQEMKNIRVYFDTRPSIDERQLAFFNYNEETLKQISPALTSLKQTIQKVIYDLGMSISSFKKKKSDLNFLKIAALNLDQRKRPSFLTYWMIGTQNRRAIGVPFIQNISNTLEKKQEEEDWVILSTECKEEPKHLLIQENQGVLPLESFLKDLLKTNRSTKELFSNFEQQKQTLNEEIHRIETELRRLQSSSTPQNKQNLKNICSLSIGKYKRTEIILFDLRQMLQKCRESIHNSKKYRIPEETQETLKGLGILIEQIRQFEETFQETEALLATKERETQELERALANHRNTLNTALQYAETTENAWSMLYGVAAYFQRGYPYFDKLYNEN